MSNRQAGDFFGWKTARVTKSFGDFSKSILEENGWTKEVFKDVAEAYKKVSETNPTNLSAMPRAKQLKELLKHFK